MPLSRFLSTTSTGSPRAWDIGYLFYDPPQSTRFDIDSATAAYSLSVVSQESNPVGVSFKPDGSKMYVSGLTGDDVNEYDLSTNWDITSASFVHSFSTLAQDTVMYDFVFKPDGTKMYIVGDTGNAVYEYDLSSAWDVSTASFVQNYPVGTQETSPRGIFIKPDGTKMFITGSAGDDVNEYTLSTAWDISTASHVQSASVNDSIPAGLEFSQDGEKMYVTGDGSNNIDESTLRTAWDVSSITFDQDFSVALQESNPIGVHFSPDGTKMYVIGLSGDDVNEYTLTTAWELSTASFVQSFSVSAQDTSASSVVFRPDGKRMFVCGYTNDAVNQYDLTTAWDVSTASFSKKAKLDGVNPIGIFFRDDGLKLFMVCLSNRNVYTYTLGQQP